MEQDEYPDKAKKKEVLQLVVIFIWSYKFTSLPFA